MKTLRLAILCALPAVSLANDKPTYPLTLEITSYKAVHNGSYTEPRSYFPIGDMVLSTGGNDGSSQYDG